jgi:GT2 family glycosyltransferase
VNVQRTQLLIVDDRSRQPATLAYLDQLAAHAGLACRVTRPPNPDGRFNYARLMNHAASLVDTPLLLHLNNDIEAIGPGWLDQMAGWMSQPGVGIVGAKLLYRDSSLQHAGVAVSSSHGVPEHLFRRLRGDDCGYQWLPHRVRSVSAVTGACLLTPTALYRDLGGFDAEHLPVQFNDIDYCLRASSRGWRTIYEPAATLYHDESASRGRAFDYGENAWFASRHATYREPFVSAHFDPDSWFGSTLVVTASPNRLA